MPIKASDTNIFNYPMSDLGVNLSRNVVDINARECIVSQNLIWRNGMKARQGQSTLTDTEVVANKKILGLHRYYKSDSTRQLLAACDTTVKYYAGSDTWTNVKTGLTTGKQTHMTTWGAKDKVYICNGTDDMHSWDGSTSADLTLSDGAPTMALPYQDRLLTIIGGTLTWSASFSDTAASWGTNANIGVNPDTKLYGMIHHSVTNADSGFESQVLLAGANGMYLFSGTNLDWTDSSNNYVIYDLGTPGGTAAARTMCWTPRGTMWLGNDRQVWLLPFNSSTPIAISRKIESELSWIDGIEDVSGAQISNACAAYHRGYYMLAVAGSGQTTNNVQWWLDITRLNVDENNSFGPWYGPMVGQTISCFANQNGENDQGELMAGEGTAYGLVYEVNRPGITKDVEPSDASDKAISTVWQSFYHPLGDPNFRKDIQRLELELRNINGSITLNFYDITGSVKTGQSVSVPGTATLWGSALWGSFTWNDRTPTRSKVDLSPAIQPRRLSLQVTHSSSTERFELYSANVEAIEQASVFA